MSPRANGLRETDRQTDRRTDGRMDRQTDRQTKTERQTDRQTDRQRSLLSPTFDADATKGLFHFSES